jgi:hypothetical protein
MIQIQSHLDQEHNDDKDEEPLLDFIIGGITKDCTKTKISLGGFVIHGQW